MECCNLSQLQASQDTYKRLQRQYESYRDQKACYSNLAQTLTSTRKNLEQELPDSDAELTLKLHNFEKLSQTKSREKVQLQRQIDENIQSIRNAQASVESLTTTQGVAASLREQYDTLVKQDKNVLKAISKKYNLPEVAEDEFLERLTNYNTQQKAQYATKKKDRDAAISALEKQYDAACANMQKVELDLKSTEYELNLAIQEKNAKHEEVYGIKSFLARNSNVKVDYDVAMRDYLEFQERYEANVMRLNQTKTELIERLNRIDEQKVVLQRNISELNAYRTERDRLQAQEDQATRDLANCEADMHVISNRSRQFQIALPGSLKEIDSVLERLSQNQRRKRTEITELSINLNKTRDTIACCDAAIKSATENAATAAEQRRQYADYLAQYRAGVDELNALRKQQDESMIDVNESRDVVAAACSETERGIMEMRTGFESRSLWRDKLLRKSTRRVPAGAVAKCPCCDRNMNRDENEIFRENIQEIFKYEEETMAKANRDYAAATALKIRMDGIIGNLNSLEYLVHDSDRIQATLRENTQMKLQLVQAKEEHEALLTALQEEVRLLDACIHDWRKLQERWIVCEDNLSSLQTRRANKSSYLTQHDKNAEEYEDELAEVEKDYKTLTRQKDKCMEDITRLNQRHTELQSRKMEMESANMEYKQKDERLKEIQNRLSELEDREGQLTEKKAKLQRDRLQLQRVTGDAKDAVTSAKQTKDAELQSLRSRCEDIARDIDNLKGWIRDVSDLRKKIKKNDLTAISSEIARLREEMLALETRNSEIQPTINLISTFINDQDHMKHLITSNLAYRELREQVAAAKRELDDMERNNVENDIRAAEREIQRCEQEKQKLLNQKYSSEVIKDFNIMPC